MIESTLPCRALPADIAQLFYFVGGGWEDEGVIGGRVGGSSRGGQRGCRRPSAGSQSVGQAGGDHDEVRRGSDRVGPAGRGGPEGGAGQAGEFVADELSLMLRQQPYP